MNEKIKYHIRFQKPYVVKEKDYHSRMEIAKDALKFYLDNLKYYFPNIEILAFDVYMFSAYVQTESESLETDMKNLKDWYGQVVERVIKKSNGIQWQNTAWSGNL